MRKRCVLGIQTECRPYSETDSWADHDTGNWERYLSPVITGQRNNRLMRVRWTPRLDGTCRSGTRSTYQPLNLEPSRIGARVRSCRTWFSRFRPQVVGSLLLLEGSVRLHFLGRRESVQPCAKISTATPQMPGPLCNGARNVGTAPLRPIESSSVSVIVCIRRRRIQGPTSGP